MTTVQNRRYLSPDRVFFDEVKRIGKFDQSAILATLDYCIPRMNDPMPEMAGFGVVTVAGGRYLDEAWAMIRTLRRFSDVPVEVYHLGPDEIRHKSVPMLKDLGVTFIDAIPLMGRENYQSRGGWSAKSCALKYTRFEKCCFMDADCIPLMNPEAILGHPEFSTGYLAFGDIAPCRKNNMLFPSLGLKYDPAWIEAEAGQFVVDKRRFWKELQLYSFMNGRPKPFHDLCHGDKSLLQLACMKLGTEFNFSTKHEWLGDAIRHYLMDGTPAFLHCGERKRSGSVRPEVKELLEEFHSL